NAIIMLTVTSVALLIIKDADVNSLVPLYAIGVFTAFAMAGFGMAKYHHRQRQPGWRYKFAINFSAGVLTTIVVIIFAVVKFTEGAWVVLLLFAILVPALIRMNHEYTAEAEVLETVTGKQPPPAPNYSRRAVFVMVDDFDLATLAALRYARSLRPTTIRAVHFVIDNVRAEQLREKWMRADRGVALDFIDCPDRRLATAASALVEREIQDEGTHVTVILPRRTYSALLGRLLHDRTADKIAQVISRLPRSAATIVPYDVPSRVAVLQERQAAARKAAKAEPAQTAAIGTAVPEPAESPEVIARLLSAEADVANSHVPPDEAMRPGRVAGRPARLSPAGVAAIGSVSAPGKVTVEGRVRVVEIRPVERNSVLAVEISDHTGNLTAMFYGRSHIPGLVCGARVRFTGSAGLRDGQPVLVNPAYELLFPGNE
ncbi:MAG TPA: OB-fold nucleic acid binding domain-containing protein, partial [Trebonia sp.]